MNRKLLFTSLLVLAIAWISACSKKSEDEFAAQQCITTNMKYSADILPIISKNCYGCHDNSTATNGITLEGYANLKVQADKGDLVAVITHASGYPPMPYNAPKLSDCDINKIKSWVQSGAPNN